MLEIARSHTGSLARYLNDCLENSLEIPAALASKLLQQKIDLYAKEESWILIEGFPRTTFQLTEFENEVSFACTAGFTELTWLGAKTQPHVGAEELRATRRCVVEVFRLSESLRVLRRVFCRGEYEPIPNYASLLNERRRSNTTLAKTYI